MTIRQMRFIALGMALLMLAGVFAFRTTLAQDQQFGSNWQGFYWDNQNFSGNPKVSRTDQAINFNWQTGSPDPAIPADHFSARWANTINFAAGTYRFTAGADDGIRVAIDNNLIINLWNDATNGFQKANQDVTLTAGNHTIIVDYYENEGNAGVQFYWVTVSGGGATPVAGTPIPGSNAIPTPNAPAGLPLSQIRAVVIVDLANVRSDPSTNSAPVAEVTRNQVLGVVANNGANTWFLVQLKDGTRGWIFRRMIYLYNGDWTKLPVSSVGVDIAPPSDTAVQGVARVETLVRDAPSRVHSEKIGSINEGQGFNILKLSRNRAWVYVDADGLQGWVYLPNVKIVLGNLGRLPVGK